METSVSIIITTYNRAEFLLKTLESVGKLKIPPHVTSELIVVDNASTDNTAEVVQSFKLPNMELRYYYEPRKGQSNARNAGMAIATGEIFLWTDDDLLLPEDWISEMCEPILSNKGEGVAGKIKMAPELERAWMTRTHYDRLADTRFMGEDFGAMIGANMGFSRKVLEKIPAFDPELGPGALGFADDSLFSYQMWEARLKIVALPAVVSEHHFDPSRLLRKSWLRHVENSGKSRAYVRYHWEQDPVKFPALQILAWKIALYALRVLQKPVDEEAEGCDRKEMRIVENIAFMKQYRVEQQMKPKYERRGLRKLS